MNQKASWFGQHLLNLMLCIRLRCMCHVRTRVRSELFDKCCAIMLYYGDRSQKWAVLTYTYLTQIFCSLHRLCELKIINNINIQKYTATSDYMLNIECLWTIKRSTPQQNVPVNIRFCVSPLGLRSRRPVESVKPHQTPADPMMSSARRYCRAADQRRHSGPVSERFPALPSALH
jgi:hypothetical protein